MWDGEIVGMKWGIEMINGEGDRDRFQEGSDCNSLASRNQGSPKGRNDGKSKDIRPEEANRSNCGKKLADGRQKHVCLGWVKSHIGAEGNTKAEDQFTKEATELPCKLGR